MFQRLNTNSYWADDIQDKRSSNRVGIKVCQGHFDLEFRVEPLYLFRVRADRIIRLIVNQILVGLSQIYNHLNSLPSLVRILRQTKTLWSTAGDFLIYHVRSNDLISKLSSKHHLAFNCLNRKFLIANAKPDLIGACVFSII